MNATNQIINAAKPLWELAISKDNVNRKQKLNNRITKREYFTVLDGIKELYKPKGEWAFERDYTTHNSDKPNAIHCFLNNGVYWHLTCDSSLNFTIMFNVADVKLKADINCLVARMPKSARWNASTKTDVPTMFKRCKQLQPDEFFYILN